VVEDLKTKTDDVVQSHLTSRLHILHPRPTRASPRTPAVDPTLNQYGTSNGMPQASKTSHLCLSLWYLQLSKEDEAATGSDEVEVRREDQDKINKFSRLHQRELNLEDDLKSKHVRGPLTDVEVIADHLSRRRRRI
jgi:hypothetical protein